MNKGRLIKFIVGLVLLCGLGIVVINHCTNFPQTMKDSLTVEFVGSGLLGGILGFLIFYLQESDEYQASKTKAKSFFEQKLLLDIQEVIDRGDRLWNLSGANKFYFDGSLCNPLYDVYQTNFDQINNHHAYFPENELVKTLDAFYKTIRKGYVLGEKMENIIYQNVRSDHHKRGLISANDPSTRSFVRGRIFADMKPEELCKYLEWKSVPERVTELYSAFEKNTDVNDLVKKIREIREELLKLIKKLESLHKKEYAKISSANVG